MSRGAYANIFNDMINSFDGLLVLFLLTSGKELRYRRLSMQVSSVFHALRHS